MAADAGRNRNETAGAGDYGARPRPPNGRTMPPAVNRTMTPFEWLLLVTLSLLWGGSYFYNAVAVKALPALKEAKG